MTGEKHVLGDVVVFISRIKIVYNNPVILTVLNSKSSQPCSILSRGNQWHNGAKAGLLHFERNEGHF